jgi:hypothetical protein
VKYVSNQFPHILTIFIFLEFINFFTDFSLPLSVYICIYACMYVYMYIYMHNLWLKLQELYNDVFNLSFIVKVKWKQFFHTPKPFPVLSRRRNVSIWIYAWLSFTHHYSALCQLIARWRDSLVRVFKDDWQVVLESLTTQPVVVGDVTCAYCFWRKVSDVNYNLVRLEFEVADIGHQSERRKSNAVTRAVNQVQLLKGS